MVDFECLKQKNNKLKMRRMIITILIICIVVKYPITVVYAANTHTRYASQFKAKWENTVYYYSDTAMKKEVGKMVYGYNTAFINEDYCWTRSYKTEHQAGVCNEKGCYYGSKRNTTKWSKKEIRHKGTEVYYYFWENTNKQYYNKLKEGTNVK